MLAMISKAKAAQRPTKPKSDDTIRNTQYGVVVHAQGNIYVSPDRSAHNNPTYANLQTETTNHVYDIPKVITTYQSGNR